MIENKEKLTEDNLIAIWGAREHNLKNISLTIPRDKLTVITGLSGSGKSSLAFDTIYAEGQRRYMETLSAYARQYLGGMDRPDVDKITGLSPVISIEQKTVSKNPRSTVGTITEIYDFLRLLYARASEAYSYNTGEKMVKYTDDSIVELIVKEFSGKAIYILAPLVRGRKGHYKELFEHIVKKGFLSVRIDGEIKPLTMGMRTDRYKNHFIEVVIDKLIPSTDEEDKKRIKTSLVTAMKQGKGSVMICSRDDNQVRWYSRQLMCPTTGISYSEPAPHSFSFNSPQGACPMCNGLGSISSMDMDKIIPDKSLSIKQSGVVPLGTYKPNSVIFVQIEALISKYGVNINTPLAEFPDELINVLINGTEDSFRMSSRVAGGSEHVFFGFEGIASYLSRQQTEATSKKAQKWAEQFLRRTVCPQCGGARLKKESLHFYIDGKNIHDLATMDIISLNEWFNGIEDRLSEKQNKIATEIIKEICNRLGFMIDVGLGYLSLGLSSKTLSGGESQRIRLATQIGSKLVNVLYILDEPSIGLHQRDSHRLIDSLKKLRDAGNTIIVVEHDKDMMLAADYIVDMGPGAGRKGGDVVAVGTPDQILQSNTLTSLYLTQQKSIPIPNVHRSGNGKHIVLNGAIGNNLKNVRLDLPLGMMVCVTGVSGSGKSSLINETLQPIISHHLYSSLTDPLPYDNIEGIEHIDKLIRIDQSPIGKTPRSNPATYTGVFNLIRDLYAQTPEAKVRAYTPGRFSFNVKGGRCETCGGAGVQTVEMKFIPDVYIQCPDCGGKRYNNETLQILYKGKTIGDVLDMTINMAVEFFQHMPSILTPLLVLQQVGLGYLKLGQSCTTLSGGESQRIKLASELSKKDTGRTLYLLDEPTTGLHFEDIRVLLDVLNRLVDRGNTVVVIEHNPDVIKTADYIIDMGPEGGRDGGNILACGTPEQIMMNPNSYTAEILRTELAYKPKSS